MRRLAPSLLLALTACNPLAFDDYENDAPIIALRSTKPFPEQTFGTLLDGYEASIAGVPVSRIVTSSGRIIANGGTDGMFAAYRGWEGTRLRVGDKLYAHCDAGTTAVCPDDAGTSIVGLGNALGHESCVAVGAPLAPEPGGAAVNVGAVGVRCETTAFDGVTWTQAAPATPDDRAGAALADVPSASAELGAAIVGAPGSGPMPGSLYLLAGTAEAPALSPLPIPNVAALAEGAQLGASLASAPIPADRLVPGGNGVVLTQLEIPMLLAAAAPGEARVYLIAVGRDAMNGGVTSAELVGCVDVGPSPLGIVLTAGDLTGDGWPEIVIGAPLLEPARADAVRIVTLAGLVPDAVSPVGCAAKDASDDPTSLTLVCPADGNVAGIACGGSGFGSSLAIGDADGDGDGDLLVGAPLANVRSVANAGAAFLLPGSGTLDGVGFTNAVALVDSDPEQNDTLGLSVAFLPTQLGGARRAEPMASAPGADRIFVFLCSGLPNDDAPTLGPRCLVSM